MTREPRTLGQWGEQVAETHLTTAGARVLLRNHRSEHGELDLLVEHEGDLVAVEVKTRTLLDLEEPEEAIHPRQLRRIANALSELALRYGYEDRHWRIDAVAVDVDVNGAVHPVEHIR